MDHIVSEMRLQVAKLRAARHNWPIEIRMAEETAKDIREYAWPAIDRELSISDALLDGIPIVIDDSVPRGEAVACYSETNL